MVVEIRAAWRAVKVGRPEWIVPYGTTSSQGTALAANRTATDGGHRGCGATMSTTPANRRPEMQDRRGDEISGGAMPANRGQGWTIESYAVAHERTAGPTAELTTLLYLYGPGVGETQKIVRLELSPTHTGLSGQYQEGQFTVVLPYEDFSAMYDLLRHEAPVYASYSWDSETTDLHRFRLGTNASEHPGEGPADIDSSLDT
jgi:hypothetical protein